MKIDRTKIVTRIVGVVTSVCAVFGIVFNIIQAFSVFGIIIAICNLVIAFVCFKGFGKDREISICVYGFLIIYEIVNTLILTNAFGISALIKIIGYMTIILYLLRIFSKKVIPIIGGLMTSGFFIYNSIQLIHSTMVFFNTFGNFEIPQSLIIKSIIIWIATVIYTVPALSMVILISCGAVIVNKNNRTLF